ncbi:ECF transporter S component [Heyndrickxia sp. NPDC080065]|uniref:ECF transporter S component n=1 Tax=Heyndrickxia sp. NPDC080065 TaxID=3390568 RepID=UPI003D072CBB
MSSRKIVWFALGFALTVIGSSIKIPAIVGSVGLDVFPALVIASLFSVGMGGVVAGLGHLISALLTGFPLGPFHILIALEMAICVLVYGFLYHSGKKILASIVFWIGNAIISPLPFILLVSWSFFIAIVPSLMIGSAFNVIVALLFVKVFQQRLSPVMKRGINDERCSNHSSK